MTQEALKELLETVEEAIQAGDWKVDGACDPDLVIRRSKEALAQPAQQEPVAWPCLIHSADFSENTITLVMQCEDYKVTAGPHYLCTTPPKQKPVAWMLDGEFYKTQQFHLQGGSYANQIPLYTAPPQRTWVGLTDEQANEYNYLGPDMPWVVREVAAILKEKNQ